MGLLDVPGQVSVLGSCCSSLEVSPRSTTSRQGGGFFPQNQKFILLCTKRVYTLFLNLEFPKLGLASASKQQYIYTQENPNKCISLILAVYVLTNMIWQLTSIIFLVTSRESKGQRDRRGSPIYCHRTSQADTGYVCNSCELFMHSTVLQADGGELIFLTLTDTSQEAHFDSL